MPKITSIELQNRTEYFTALYINDQCESLDIVFSHEFQANANWQGIALLNIEHRGMSIKDDSLWDRVRTLLEQTLDEQKECMPTARFTVSLEIPSLWMLEKLSRSPVDIVPTPEAHLEADILRQIVEQARRNRLI
jgi:hypothetical protein